MEFLILLGKTLLLRPYVFLFLAIALATSVWLMGTKRTALFFLLTWATAFLCEFSSTRTGIPFGWYFYTGSTRGQELYLSNVPFMDSLSFSFLLFTSYCLALVFLLPARGPGLSWELRDNPAIRRSGLVLALTTLLFMLLDVVIDPVALRGDRWFLGKIRSEEHTSELQSLAYLVCRLLLEKKNGRIGGAHLEAVAAVGQAAVALRARAGCEGTPVELAGEGAAGLGGREAEARAAAGASGRRRGRDGRVRRRGIHRPGVAGRRRVGVAGRIGRAHLEAVAAVGQAAIALRAQAGCEGTRVELTGEGAAGLGGGEAEARAAGIAASRRGGRDARVRRRGIHPPGIAGRRRVGVAGRIGRAHLEAVAAVGQAAITLGAHADREGTRIELAGEGAAALSGGEAEAGAAGIAASRGRGPARRVSGR